MSVFDINDYNKQKEAVKELINNGNYNDNIKRLLFSYVNQYFERYFNLRNAMITLQRYEKNTIVKLRYNKYSFPKKMEFLNQDFHNDLDEIKEEFEFFRKLFCDNHFILLNTDYIDIFCNKHFKSRNINRTWAEENDYSSKKKRDCEMIMEFNPLLEEGFDSASPYDFINNNK